MILCLNDRFAQVRKHIAQESPGTGSNDQCLEVIEKFRYFSNTVRAGGMQLTVFYGWVDKFVDLLPSHGRCPP